MIDDDGSLKIPMVRSKDEGIYQCVATNLAGNSSLTLTLSVLGKYGFCILCWLYLSQGLRIRYSSTIILLLIYNSYNYFLFVDHSLSSYVNLSVKIHPYTFLGT